MCRFMGLWFRWCVGLFLDINIIPTSFFPKNGGAQEGEIKEHYNQTNLLSWDRILLHNDKETVAA